MAGAVGARYNGAVASTVQPRDMMSAIAETTAFAADDRLARRNALVLAMAQALAGGNNTVIAATAGIIGAVLAPDKGLATLPVSVMVLGMWFGTLPIGCSPRNFGRRFALADRLRGRNARRPRVLRGGAAGLVRRCSLSAPSAAASTPRRTNPIASPPPTPPATASSRRRFPTCWPAA